MKRREFVNGMLAALVASSGAAIWPSNAYPQFPIRTRRVAVLVGAAQDAEGQSRVSALPKGLSEIGWIDGSNLRLDIRYVGASLDLARSLASEIVAFRPDVI